MKCFLVGTLLLMGALNAAAQFTPAVVNDVAYPAGSPVLRPDDIHSYSAEVSISGNIYTLNVYGWNNASTTAEGLAWRLMSGATLVSAGVIPIPNSSSIDMGIVNENSTGLIKVVVAYHKTGVGHYMDIYNATLGGLSLVSSSALSNANALPRIAVDAHKLYGVLISWADPQQGIFVKTLNTNTGPLTVGITHVLTNTYKSMDPDITFTHANSSGALNAHVAFHRTSPNQMEEQSMDFFAMHGSGIPSFTGTVNDVAPIPLGSDVGPASIDAPEHATVENWAYAYSQFNPSSGYGPILTRVFDGAAMMVNQYDATEGPFGITPSGPYDFSTRLNRGPSLAFDQNQDAFRIAWYFSPSFSVTGRYIVQFMKIDGSLLNPGGTYLNAEVSPTGNQSGTRCITLNPNNSTPDNFTAYGHFNGSQYSIKVKSLPWTLSSFKVPTAVGSTVALNPDFKVYPNPSVAVPTISFSGPLGDAQIDAVMLNSAGQVVARGRGDGQDAGMQLISNWDRLPAGLYTIRITAEAISYDAIRTILKN